MQNSKNVKGSPFVSTTDIRKPNILRRKTVFSPTNSLNRTVGERPSLLSENPQNSELTPDNKDAVNNHVKQKSEKVTAAKETKTNTRIHRPAQKIILDTYICDKYRKSFEKSNSTNDNNAVSIPEANNVNSTNSDIDNLIMSTVVIDVADISNNGNEENGQNIELSTENILVEENNTLTLNELSREQVLAILESGKFDVGQLLLGEGAEQVQYWFCPVVNCDKIYGERPELHNHILTHFNLTSFKCKFSGCAQEFISEDLLTQHCREVHVERGRNAKVDKLSQVVSSVISIEDGDAGEPGCIIDAALASVGITETHLISVQQSGGGRRWICPHDNCDLHFKALNLLKNHILIHYNLRPFKCNHEGCQWGFLSLHKLRKHLNVHKVHDKVSHACTFPGCQKQFTTNYNLSIHLKGHEKQKDFSCPARDCMLTFSLRADVESHIEEKHNLDEAVHCCGLCGKRFWWSTALAVHHARVHTHTPGEPICTWPGCGKRFSQPCKLRYHYRSHTGDKPYRCTYKSCNMAFSLSSKLRRHARAHSDNSERKYVCNICHHAFLRSQHLKEHILRHMPQRNHQCDYPGCEQKFSNKSSVHKHKRREHGISAAANKTEQIEAVDNIPNLIESSTDFISMEACDYDLLSLRSARTHVPWSPDISRDLQSPLLPLNSGLLLQQRSCDEKQGNPLVCGGLTFDNDNSAVSAGLILEVDGSEIPGLPELETDLLETSGDHINSLLLQEELSDGMLYTTEEEAALHVLLLNEEPAP